MLEAGAVLDGKYRLEQRLGAGGMGSVHRATHLGTDRPVAVKLIGGRFSDRPEFVERFRREARAAGRLRHPNVVDVTDFGVADVAGAAVPYLVMELLEGRTLADALAEEPVPPLEWTSEVLEQACTALEAAHRRGIVHRDLKPENLWLEPDGRGGFTVKVLDFGLAHLGDAPPAAGPRGAAPVEVDDESETVARVSTAATGASTLTRVGDVLGTPAFMAPEQWRGEALDARTDVYALGVLAWRMLAGRAPYAGSLAEVQRAHLAGVVPELPPTVPASIRVLVTEAMDRDPARRPRGAAAFAAAFRARAQSKAMFLRDVVTLTTARWSQLIRVSLVAFAFPLALSLAGVAAGLLVTGPTGARWSMRAMPLLFVGLTVGLGGLGVLAEALLLHALVVPRRTVPLRSLIEGLRPRDRAYLGVMLPYYLGFGIPALLAAIAPAGPKALRVLVGVLSAGFIGWVARHMDAFWFAAQAVMSEGLDGDAARARSRALAQQMKQHLGSLEMVANGLIAAVGFGAAFAGGLLAVGLHRAWPAHELLTRAAACFVALLLVTITMPIGSMAFGLLYFRTRESMGEPLPQILAGFEEKLGVPVRPQPEPTPPRSA